jgi:hypothetical protein
LVVWSVVQQLLNCVKVLGALDMLLDALELWCLLQQICADKDPMFLSCTCTILACPGWLDRWSAQSMTSCTQ